MYEFYLESKVRLRTDGLRLTEQQLREYRLEYGKIYRVTNVEIRSLRVRDHEPHCEPGASGCKCSWAHQRHYFFCLDSGRLWIPASYFEKVEKT